MLHWRLAKPCGRDVPVGEDEAFSPLAAASAQSKIIHKGAVARLSTCGVVLYAVSAKPHN